MAPARTAWVLRPKRSADELQTGTRRASANRNKATTSRSDAAIGLSMNNGLPASITGMAWARCTRPSTLVNNTASTLRHSSATVS